MKMGKQKFMENNPLNPVIIFYAGLTKLKNKKVQAILMAVQNIQQDPITFANIRTELGWKHLAVLNSLYECQDGDLVKIFTPNTLDYRISQMLSDPPIPHNAHLYFAFLPLYPSDCLSLTYYARLKLRSMNKESLLSITITLCSITI